MSKRNNRKKGKQENTQNEVHAMAREWQNSKDDERVLVLFSLSEFGRLRFYVRGPRLQFLSLLNEEIAPRLNSLANEPLIDYPYAPSNQAEETKSPSAPPLMVATCPRLALSFFQNLTVCHGAQSQKHPANIPRKRRFLHR